MFATYDDPTSNDDARKKRDELHAAGIRCCFPIVAGAENDERHRDRLRQENDAAALAEASLREIGMGERSGGPSTSLRSAQDDKPVRRRDAARKRGPAMSVEEIERLKRYHADLERMHLD